MARVYQVVCVVVLLLATSCGSSEGGAVQTATSLPPATAPVATTVVAATPTTVQATPTEAATATTAPTATVEETAVETMTAETITTPDGSTLSGERRTDLQGKLLFSRVGDSDLWVYTPQDGAVRLLIENAREARWSPDATRLTFVRDDGVYVADADSGEAQRIYEGTDLHAPVWSPDGTYLAFEYGTFSTVQASERQIWTADIQTSEARKVGDGTDPAWSPDGQQLAYVTVAGDDAPRRTELRVVDRNGENARTLVSDLPEGTPPIGIPDNQVQPADLEHVMEQPFWDVTGDAIYVASFVNYQVLSGFSIWERVNVAEGGSTFISELPEVMGTTPAPDRRATLFSVSSARGDTWLVARGVGTEDATFAWAETPQGAIAYAPAWSPDSAAVAYIGCDLEDSTRCDLRVRTADGEDVVVPDVHGGAGGESFVAPSLDWTTDD